METGFTSSPTALRTRPVKVPISALAGDPDSEATVWVVDPETMTVSARVVGLGQMAADEVEIVSGIMPGDMIAITGATQLADGMQVSRFGDAP